MPSCYTGTVPRQARSSAIMSDRAPSLSSEGPTESAEAILFNAIRTRLGDALAAREGLPMDVLGRVAVDDYNGPAVGADKDRRRDDREGVLIRGDGGRTEARPGNGRAVPAVGQRPSGLARPETPGHHLQPI